jgi:hypothetical protein
MNDSRRILSIGIAHRQDAIADITLALSWAFQAKHARSRIVWLSTRVSNPERIRV